MNNYFCSKTPLFSVEDLTSHPAERQGFPPTSQPLLSLNIV